jgi:D-glycero-D-manno-heptose 1,7-bisphosphate phosphatase
MSRPAAFLDRDGTINTRPPLHRYVEAPEAFAWLPGAVDGAVMLAEAGFVLVVVSNQRGVARGLVTESTLREIESQIQARLGERGCHVESFRYCRHDRDVQCDCRKPRPGMLLDAARELDLDLRQSWMIGDSPSDVQAGARAGCHTALIAPGDAATDADIRAPTLLEASRLLLATGSTVRL